MTTKEEQARRLMEGHVGKDAKFKRFDVRVFFSSTFTDMTTERNYLMKYVVPKLRRYCLMQGLDFQVIDMRWGVRDESSIDHTTTEIVEEEIYKARVLSSGPYFVSFLGDKYGSRMIPHYIEATEFKLLRGIAMKLGHDITIMDQWFQRDDNADPAVYYLRPITDLLIFYDDDSPENSGEKERNRKEWDTIQKKLLKMLRAAADEAYENQQITKDARHVYYTSVTESEIKTGVLTASPFKDRVINYLRAFDNINIEDQIAGRFTDLLDGQRDLEAKDLLERLKITKLQPILGPNEIKKYVVNWSPVGIDVTKEEHKEYLQDLCDHFYENMVRMIDLHLEDKDYLAKLHISKALFSEVSYHAAFASWRLTLFSGMEDVLEDIQARISCSYSEKPLENDVRNMQESLRKEATQDDMENYKKQIKDCYDSVMQQANKINFKFVHGDLDYDIETDPDRNVRDEAIMMPNIQSFNRPIVIFGESGSGKTALMSKIAFEVKNWYPNSVTVLRFLGTTSNSTSIREVILGICFQIWYLYNISEPSHLDLGADFQYLVKYFFGLLWKIDAKSKPLFIILDSVDQLLPSDNSYNMHWIPTKVPSDVHLIVSMSPKVNKCFQNTLDMIPYTEQYVEISEMSVNLCSDIINTTLKFWKRRLTKPQRRFIGQKVSACMMPLYLKLTLGGALTWKSGTTESEFHIGDNIKQCINIHFDNMEKTHGQVVVSKLMAFMSASRDGIGRSELEDLLSLDDEVLQDTYLYHLPPDPENIHIPSSILTRIMSDIFEYIQFRYSGHMIVLNWYHRQFREAGKERYLPKKIQKDIHAKMAEYFEGYWHGRPKPLELYKVKKGSYPKADRNVQLQPIKFKNNLYNARKLTELPYHLIESHQFERFRELCACNFDFLFGKLKTFSNYDLQVDMRNALHKMDDTSYLDSDNVYSDIETVSKILMLGHDVIRKDVNMLAVQIISRMGPSCSASPFLKKLVQDALTWCGEVKTPLLIPTMICAPAPWGILKYEITSEVFMKEGDSCRCYNRAVHLCDSEETLLIIQPYSAKINQDDLYVLDLKDYGTVVHVQAIAKNINSVTSMGNNRFIHLQDTNGYESLYDSKSWKPIKFQYDPDTITVSKSGRLLVYTAVSKIYICRAEESDHMVKSGIELEAKDSPIQHAVISPDENYLVTISKAFVLIWDLISGELLHEQEKKSSSAPSINKTALPDVTFITNSNKLIAPYMGDEKTQKASLALTDLATGHIQCVMSSCNYAVTILAIHPSQKYAAAGTNEAVLLKSDKAKPWKMWNLETGELVTTAVDKRLFTVNGVDALQVFGNDDMFAAVATHPIPAICIAYLGTVDQALREAVPYCFLGNHCDKVIQMIVSPDQCSMYSIGCDNIIKVWDLQQVPTNFVSEFGQNADAKKVEEFFKKSKMSEGYTSQFRISKDEQQVFIASSEGHILVHNLEDHSCVRRLSFEDQKIDHLLVSSNGKYVIAANTETGQIYVIDAATFETHQQLKHRSSITCMCEANDILVVGTSGTEAEGTVFNISTGKLIKKFELLYSLRKVAINSDGTKFVASLFDFPFTVPVEGEGTAMSIDKIDSSMADLTCISVSPDDNLALGGSADGNIRVVTMDGNYLFRFLQKSSVKTAVFSPDCKFVVSGGYKSMYIWNIQNGSLTFKLKKHNSFVDNILFDKTGKCMVSSSHDRKIILWNFSTCLSLATFHAHCDIHQVEMTADSSKIFFVPEGIDYITTLVANGELKKLMAGKNSQALTSSLLKAQAVALSFSSQKIQQKTSSACQIS